MSRSLPSLFILVTGAVCCLAGVLAESASAQTTPETPRIVTVDGVKLNAAFYPSDKKTAPTVIMLHPIGEGKSIRNAAWKSLAEKLQKAGYNVMMFDFRGHGDSTTIDDMTQFRMYPQNRFNLKQPETIDYRDYKGKASAYLPVLINDIAAIKAYLDRKNDAEGCNTSSTIVIGAKEGATLGACWINSEWARYRFTPPMNMFMKPDFDKNSQGKDIIAMITLSAAPKLGLTRNVSLSSAFKIASKDHGMANLFFYGKDDVNCKKATQTIVHMLKPASKGKDDVSPKHKFIGSYELNTKLSGVPLLQVPAGEKTTTEDLIVTYLDKVVAERGNEWVNRDWQNSSFMWLPQQNAKTQKGEKNLNFNDYLKFVP